MEGRVLFGRAGTEGQRGRVAERAQRGAIMSWRPPTLMVRKMTVLSLRRSTHQMTSWRKKPFGVNDLKRLAAEHKVRDGVMVLRRASCALWPLQEAFAMRLCSE